jgi:UDP-N-acetylglucosamine--dolichyl-phosphate N-acetylglucosaminephosphotransferase
MEAVITYLAVSGLAPFFQKLGIVGKDLHKKDKRVLPEAMGLVAGIVLVSTLEKNYIAGSVLSGLWIGGLDDIIDIRWRYKLLFSAAAYIFIIAESNTSVSLFGYLFNLGPIYHIYMILWCIWCGNAINIYAGINGIEVGQTLIIAFGLLFFCSAKNAIISYIFVAVALLLHNKYPASVFVGDSWCYLSGMFFVAVARHETEQLAIIMFPQIINTILSLPELTGYKDCPRHRMPKYDESTDKLYHSGYGTLMNIILWANGPMHESALFYILVKIQIAAVVCAILIFSY